MKQSLLLILLLGFGALAPMTCAKSKDKKSSSDEAKKEKQVAPADKAPKQMALYGPVGLLRPAQGRS
jgi:hypothetical protein